MQLAAVAELMMNELEWRQVEEDFMSQGFLAPTGEQVRQYVRESLREWVSAALDLNKVAKSAYVRSHRRTDVISSGAARTVLLIMPRCLSGFQGAIVLAERGLGIEAQALVRHVFECTFWMSRPKRTLDRRHWRAKLASSKPLNDASEESLLKFALNALNSLARWSENAQCCLARHLLRRSLGSLDAQTTTTFTETCPAQPLTFRSNPSTDS
jgi:hypothetical protein